jgi:transcriptional regulator with XRE-family HTH domain
MHIGERLRRARERRGWNQRELARNAHVDHAWVSRLESGEKQNVSLDVARRLALALGISTDYLAGLTTRPLPVQEESPCPSSV